MKLRCFILLLLALGGCVLSLRAQPQPEPLTWSPPKKGSVYFSPGSNNVRGDLIPLSSAQSIDEAFDGAQKTFGATRVLWRGLQEEDYDRHEEFRRDNLWLYEMWQWSKHLSLDLKLNRHAVGAAHRRGMTIWGLTSVFEFGAEPREGVYAAMELGPATSEDRLRVRHREWIPTDRYGIRRQTGPLEFAYPEARRALCEQLVKEVLRHDYDGLMLLTYVENTDQWFEDEFGFNEPIVQEFKRRYGVDIRTQSFDVAAWRKLRGEYFTQFLRELSTALHASGKKLGVTVDPRRPEFAQPWLGLPKMSNAGSLEMDWRVWLSEGIVDEIMVGSQTGSTEFAPQLAAPKPKAGLKVSVLSHPRPPSEALATAILPGWDLIVSGSVPAFETEVAMSKGGVLARRRDIRELAAKGNGALAAIEARLRDKDHAVRVAAVVALGKVYKASTPLRIFEVAARGSNFQFQYEAAQALSKMKAEATPAIVAGLDSRVLAVRRLAVEALRQGEVRPLALPRLLRVLSDEDVWMRWAATLAVGRLSGEDASTQSTVTRALLLRMRDSHPTVRAAAAHALGGLFANGRGDVGSRKQVLASLSARFGEFGTTYRGIDAEWGFKTPGRALQTMGADGEDVLKMFLQSHDTRLADHAWRSLYLPPSPLTASVQTLESAEEYYKLHPAHRLTHHQ